MNRDVEYQILNYIQMMTYPAYNNSGRVRLMREFVRFIKPLLDCCYLNIDEYNKCIYIIQNLCAAYGIDYRKEVLS